jgi:hypothetical protein
MLPFSLCNKKRLAIRHMNRLLFPTILSIPSYDIGKLVGLRTYQHLLVKLGFISTPAREFCTNDSSFSADIRLNELDDIGLIPGKIRNSPLCHHFQIGSPAYHSTIGKRVQRVRGEKITTPQENKVELRCSILYGTERSVTNIGIHFQCKTPTRFQALTKYQ